MTVYVLVKTQVRALSIFGSVLVAIMAQTGIIGIHSRSFPYIGGGYF